MIIFLHQVYAVRQQTTFNSLLLSLPSLYFLCLFLSLSLSLYSLLLSLSPISLFLSPFPFSPVVFFLQLRVEHYFVSTQKNRSMLFSYPMVVPCLPVTSRSQVYETVYRQVQRLIIPDPPMDRGWDTLPTSVCHTKRVLCVKMSLQVTVARRFWPISWSHRCFFLKQAAPSLHNPLCMNNFSQRGDASL